MGQYADQESVKWEKDTQSRHRGSGSYSYRSHSSGSSGSSEFSFFSLLVGVAVTTVFFMAYNAYVKEQERKKRALKLSREVKFV